MESGLYLSIILLNITLKILMYLSSFIPLFKGTLTVKNFPLPSPISSIDPVDGK